MKTLQVTKRFKNVSCTCSYIKLFFNIIKRLENLKHQNKKALNKTLKALIFNLASPKGLSVYPDARLELTANSRYCDFYPSTRHHRPKHLLIKRHFLPQTSQKKRMDKEFIE